LESRLHVDLGVSKPNGIDYGSAALLWVACIDQDLGAEPGLDRGIEANGITSTSPGL